MKLLAECSGCSESDAWRQIRTAALEMQDVAALARISAVQSDMRLPDMSWIGLVLAKDIIEKPSAMLPSFSKAMEFHARYLFIP